METGISTVLCLLYPVKDKKNNAIPCAVSPLFLLSIFKRFKRIRIRKHIDMFIPYGIHSSIMGVSHTGQQRFVTVAYRLLLINGAQSSHELMDYMRNHHPTKCRNMTVRKASCLFATHPMFVRLCEQPYNNGRYKYQVAAWDAVPEEVVVRDLVEKINKNLHIMFAFRKYPPFIRDQVNKILSNSPLNTPKEILNNR